MVRQIFFGVALFLSSAGGLVIEIVAGRLIAPYVGMSLYTWTAIIAVVLAGLSAGHWIGGRLATRDVDAKAAAGRLAVSLGLASASALAILVLLRVLSAPLLGSGIGPLAAVIVLSTALFLLPSLFVGIVAPILTKLAIDANPAEPGPVIGRMYALGTLGSIAGTLGAGYLFISWIGSIGTVLSVAAVYAALALSCLFAGAPRKGPTGMALALLLAGFGAWGQQVRAFDTPCTVESDYFCIRVDDFSAMSGRPSALMALDHLVHSINDKADPTLLFSPYVHFVDEYAAWRIPPADQAHRRAFFIGGGGYSLPRAWAHEWPEAQLTVAEIDPAVTRAAEAGLWLDPKHPSLDIHHRDARALLQSRPAEPIYDVVFGDAFRDIAIPSHLVTQEFHAEIAKRLKTSGFYVVNVVDSGSQPRFLAAFVKTLMVDFPSVEIWAEAEELQAGLAGRGQRVTYIVVASKAALSAGRLTSQRGPLRDWQRWPLARFASHISAGTPILTDDFAPVDRLMAHLLLTPEH